MNKRIEELVKQATTIEIISGRGFDETQYIDRFDKQKFAELIVKECLAVITPTEHDTGNYVDFSNGLKLAQYRIGKHFGIEQ